MEEKEREPVSKHVAGIVPVSNVSTDMDLLVPPCLLPLENGFYPIQRSILECAYAGCQTIWLVCRDDIGPLVKKVCGDFVVDPKSIASMKFKKFPSENIKYIPIFYVPISYKNQDKGGIAVSVLEGITSAFVVSDKFSKWVVPHRYYVTSPYGVYDPQVISQSKKDIKSSESLVLTCGGDSMHNGSYLGFSLSSRQFKHCNYIFKRSSPKEVFTLDKIFNIDIMKENLKKKEIVNYFDISSWDGYKSLFERGLGFEVLPFWKALFNSEMKKLERFNN